jgi:hypothetical protein
MSLKCIFGCQNLVYVTCRVVSGGMMDDDTYLSVYRCTTCNKIHEKTENR